MAWYVRDGDTPELLADQRIDPTRAGAPWWRYERPEIPGDEEAVAAPPGTGGGANGSTGVRHDSDDDEAAADRAPAHHAGIADTTLPSPIPLAVCGGLMLTALLAGARLGVETLGTVLVPLAAILFAAAFARHARIAHPDEPWLGRWVMFGLLAKLVASYVRYWTLVVGYGGVGDASMYDSYGRRFARAWAGVAGTAPELADTQQTNFIRWFTGVIYYLVGPDMVAGFMLFALFAFLGSYLWYRATVDLVPFIDRRVYLGLMLFAPSIVFWPSSIGKESLMQLGIGAMALGTSLLLRQVLVKGLVVAAAGGWVLWVVRPHLLAMVAIAGGVAYVFGRVKRADGKSALLGRPIGMVAIAFLVVFTVTEGAAFLGVEEFSLAAIEEELDEQTARSAQGGSEYDHGGNQLGPLSLPRGAVTVLLRPFPWETDSAFQLLASLESALLTLFIFRRLGSLRMSLSRSRTHPYLLYCWTLTAIYAVTFSSFANFGLLVRQRSLVMPALFVLLAVDVAKAKRHATKAASAPSTALVPAPEVPRG